MLSRRHYVRREPIGVCVGIVPWNFPFTMGIWKVAMAALMGNSVILKPASDTPLSALALARVIAESKIPKGVINIISGPGGALGQVLCTHPKVDKIAFTGSTEVGGADHGDGLAHGEEGHARARRQVGQHRAGRRRPRFRGRRRDPRLVPALGPGLRVGHAPAVAGFALRQIHAALRARVEQIRVGYQLHPKTKMGPLVSKKQLESVADYVRIGRDEGAELVTGGQRGRGRRLPEGLLLRAHDLRQRRATARASRRKRSSGRC